MTPKHSWRGKGPAPKPGSSDTPKDETTLTPAEKAAAELSESERATLRASGIDPDTGQPLNPS